MLDYLAPLQHIARQVGDVMMQFVQKGIGQLNVEQKPDATPLTAADRAAHRIVLQGLARLTPTLPVLSEEGELPAYAERQGWQRYWLVDPLDGTRGFLAGSLEFTLNIALIEQGEPVVALIYVPSQQICYYAARGWGAYRVSAQGQPEPLQPQRFSAQHYRVWLGRCQTSTQAWSVFANLPACEVLRAHSSLKFCKLAEGAGDIYPRFGPTSEWDTAAGQCLLEAVGGCVIDLQQQPLRYNQKPSLLNPAFVALADARAAAFVIELMQQRRNSS